MEKKTKILLIDDEENFTHMVKLRLEEGYNYEVRVLQDAKEIISNIHTFQPDVILLDLLMPGIGGLEACEMLNRDPIGMNTPVIIVSALDKEADKVKAYKLGVVDYLVKPVESSDLIASIQKAVKFKKD